MSDGIGIFHKAQNGVASNVYDRMLNVEKFKYTLSDQRLCEGCDGLPMSDAIMKNAPYTVTLSVLQSH